MPGSELIPGMAFESELIYAAQMFMKAHQQEIAGEKLP
jgi:hypothetical protein